MKSQRTLMVCALGMLAMLAAVTDARAQEVTCQSAQFSEQVVARFPRVREGCLGVVMRDGEPYATFKATVARVRSDGVDVRFLLPDGGKSDRRYIKTAPERRVIVDGKGVRVRDLAVGQELTAYVKVSEPVVALAQPADEPVAEPAPLEEFEPSLETRSAEATPDAMPETASVLPLLALVGGVLVLIAAGMRRIRKGA